MRTGGSYLCDKRRPDDRRRNMPRWQKEAFEANMRMVDRVKDLATQKGCTAGQLALAWVHAQGPDVFPIPGTKRIKYLEVRRSCCWAWIPVKRVLQVFERGLLTRIFSRVLSVVQHQADKLRDLPAQENAAAYFIKLSKDDLKYLGDAFGKDKVHVH